MNLSEQAAKSNQTRLVRVDRETEGQRIDNFLMRHLKGVPRSHLYRVLRRGEVRVNKGRVKADYRVRADDMVRIPPMRVTEPGVPTPVPAERLGDLRQAILYEDDRLIVLDKPAGLAVHGGSGLSYGLIEALRQMRPGKELELVHRLDRETSGCLLVSKRRSALRELHGLMRDNRLDKRYLALLTGPLERSEVVVDAPLRKNVLRSGERMVHVDNERGKPARSIFRRLGQFSGYTLAEVRLLTGRTHQIRVHARHLGVPLAGDPKYGDDDANRRLRELGLRRLFLHASALTFRLDYLERSLRVEAPLPAALENLIKALEREQ